MYKKTLGISILANVMRTSNRTVAALAIIFFVALAVFFFFLCCYPYHFFHREQYSLFLPCGEFVRQMFSQGVYDERSWLPAVAGGYLTQFYYYVGGGPAVVSAVALALGLSAFACLRRLGVGVRASLAVSVALILWEAGRQCVGEYPLSSSLSLLSGCLAALAYPAKASAWVRSAAFVVISALCVTSLGYGGFVSAAYVGVVEAMRRLGVRMVAAFAVLIFVPHGGFKGGVWFGHPDFKAEAVLRADVRTSRGVRLSAADFPECVTRGGIGNALRTLSLVRNNADAAVDSLNFKRDVLFLPVDPSGGYMQFTAAGEVWFALGDMTMAEHATQLGMIFSPSCSGARHVRRLAEINIVRGDASAASKYLHILGRTTVRSQWASACSVKWAGGCLSPRLEALRGLAPRSDTLRSSADYRRSLRNLLSANPHNDMARVYLLALDMQGKALSDFVDDYLAYGRMRMTRAYAEALMAAMATAPPEARERLGAVRVPGAVVRDFERFNDMLGRRDVEAMRREFAGSYWLYCQLNE